MTLDEAINELQHQCCVPNSVFLTPPYQARALAIEALSFYKIMKLKRCFDPDYLLPGETNEGTARGCRALLT